MENQPQSFTFTTLTQQEVTFTTKDIGSMAQFEVQGIPCLRIRTAKYGTLEIGFTNTIKRKKVFDKIKSHFKVIPLKGTLIRETNNDDSMPPLSDN